MFNNYLVLIRLRIVLDHHFVVLLVAIFLQFADKEINLDKQDNEANKYAEPESPELKVDRNDQGVQLGLACPLVHRAVVHGEV